MRGLQGFTAAACSSASADSPGSSMWRPTSAAAATLVEPPAKGKMRTLAPLGRSLQAEQAFWGAACGDRRREAEEAARGRASGRGAASTATRGTQLYAASLTRAVRVVMLGNSLLKNVAAG
eukprot:1781766-Pleurochrysis_carterae.AAC.3